MEKKEKKPSNIPEGLYDHPVTIVGVKGWVVLLGCMALGVGIFFWSFLVKIPLSVEGTALLADPNNIEAIRARAPGQILEIRAVDGDLVKQGDILLVLDSEEIASPFDGMVVRVNLSLGELVEPERVLLYLEKTPEPADCVIFGFFPLSVSSQIKPGMKALCAFDSVDEGRYGMLVGEVQKILAYPVGTQEFYVQQIPSSVLRSFLVEGKEPCYLAFISLPVNPKTPSGLTWTSHAGPPFAIAPGLVGEVRVIIQEVTPLEFLR